MDFAVAFNPEFLREGTSVYDFYNPPKTVIGSDDPRAITLLQEIYKGLPGDMLVTGLEVSEMVKYADNNFHAVKVTFANEIGMICKKLGIDSHEVMDIFCRDHKLNISVLLPQTRVCLRRFVPAEGCQCALLQGPFDGPGDPAPAVAHAQQQSADRRGRGTPHGAR